MGTGAADQRPVIISAHPKINLFLAVDGLRPDGYHEVETVYQAIELLAGDGCCVADEIMLVPRPCDITLSVDPPLVFADEQNLCWRAAHILRERCGVQLGVSIQLRKRLPIGAGLGGGSSDAAAVLRGLNALWQLGLPHEVLAECAAELGSDVAFFLTGGTAVGTGRGERLQALPTPELALVAAWPGTHLSTRDVYHAYDEGVPRGATTLDAMVAAISDGDSAHIAACLRNDLQETACRLCPEIIESLDYLGMSGLSGVLVSGSGSAVFGIASDARQAQQVASALSADLRIWARSARSTFTLEQSAPPSTGVQHGAV